VTVHNFEEVIAWKKSKVLTQKIYAQFNSCNDYAFRDQIQRASISIMNNIAEGFERQSNKELTQFLYIAKGSCGEVRSMIIIAKDLKYLTDTNHDELYSLSLEVSKIISGFITSLRKS